MKRRTWTLMLAALMLVLVAGACKEKNPTEPSDPPKFPTALTGALIIDDVTGKPLWSKAVDIDTGVDRLPERMTGEDGLTNPEKMSYPKKFFEQRPWVAKVSIRNGLTCGPGATQSPCIKEIIDQPVNLDWANDPRWGSYLRATVRAQRQF